MPFLDRSNFQNVQAVCRNLRFASGFGVRGLYGTVSRFKKVRPVWRSHKRKHALRIADWLWQ
jgi:hypothetical protein